MFGNFLFMLVCACTYFNIESCTANSFQLFIFKLIYSLFCTLFFRYRFMDIVIGWPGSVHDARVFSNSSLYSDGVLGKLFPPVTETISNLNIRPVIIADGAYPLLPWVMKPFSDNGKLSTDELYFNYRLSHARMCVENAFGRLKGRFRCLTKRLDTKLENSLHIIGACCVLHNICEMEEDNYNLLDFFCKDFTNNHNHPILTEETVPHFEINAIKIRNSFKLYFKDNGLNEV